MYSIHTGKYDVYECAMKKKNTMQIKGDVIIYSNMVTYGCINTINIYTGDNITHIENEAYHKINSNNHIVYNNPNYVIIKGVNEILQIWDITTYKLLQVINSTGKDIVAVYLQNNVTELTESYDTNKITRPIRLKKNKRNKNKTNVKIIVAKKYVISNSLGCHDVNTHSHYYSSHNPSFMFSLDGHLDTITSICAKDNLIVSSSKDKTIRIWNVTPWRSYYSDECIKVLLGHTDSVTRVVISDNMIISCSVDKTIRIWDMITYECTHILVGHTDTVISAQFTNTYNIHNAHNVYNSYNTHNNNIIVSCSNDNTIRIWDINTSTCLRQLDNFDNDIMISIILKDNLIIAELDHTIQVIPIVLYPTEYDNFKQISIYYNLVNNLTSAIFQYFST